MQNLYMLLIKLFTVRKQKHGCSQFIVIRIRETRICLWTIIGTHYNFFTTALLSYTKLVNVENNDVLVKVINQISRLNSVHCQTNCVISQPSGNKCVVKRQLFVVETQTCLFRLGFMMRSAASAKPNNVMYETYC